MSGGRAAARAEILGAREPKSPPDPERAIDWLWETERGVRAPERRVLTVFLAGAECPFACLFCDLWKQTLDGPTPPGALPRQLRVALSGAGAIPPEAAIKLYNASNFFDARAVPPEDDEALARLCDPFVRVTVESHPRRLGARCVAFAGRLSGRLEVAMGLETVHPGVLPFLKDGMTLADYEKAARWLCARDIGVRTFVLVGLPRVPEAEWVGWAVRSATFAAGCGVDRVSLIPLRADSAALGRLSRAGELPPVRREHVEAALAESRAALDAFGTLVEVDPWDLHRLPGSATDG